MAVDSDMVKEGIWEKVGLSSTKLFPHHRRVTARALSQQAKPKKKVTPKIQPDIHSESEESDKGEGPSNAAQYVLHILQHATANKAAPLVSGNLFARRSNHKYQDYTEVGSQKKKGQGGTVRGTKGKAAARK